MCKRSCFSAPFSSHWNEERQQELGTRHGSWASLLRSSRITSDHYRHGSITFLLGFLPKLHLPQTPPLTKSARISQPGAGNHKAYWHCLPHCIDIAKGPGCSCNISYSDKNLILQKFIAWNKCIHFNLLNLIFKANICQIHIQIFHFISLTGFLSRPLCKQAQGRLHKSFDKYSD